MTVAAVILTAGFVVATLVAPAWQQWRNHQRLLDRLGRADTRPPAPDWRPIARRTDPATPPNQRRLTDHEWVEYANGLEQT